MRTRSVLGVSCFAGDLDQAAQTVIDRIDEGTGGYACLANAHLFAVARRDAAVEEAVEGAWTVFPDGWPIAWLQRRQGAAASRIGGPDLMPLMLDRGRANGLRHFLFGSTPEAVERLAERIRVTTPGAQLAGTLAIGSLDERATVEEIAETQPDVVWCGLGAPRQELWMRRWAPALAPAVALGVGAAFDFVGGTKPRAPVWMQKSGLEWFHRFVHEPRRLGWRYLSTNVLFAMAVLRERSR